MHRVKMLPLNAKTDYGLRKIILLCNILVYGNKIPQEM
jgi:hypothetical protein